LLKQIHLFQFPHIFFCFCVFSSHSLHLFTNTHINIIIILQNGDLNWIVKGKICAFAGPSYEKYISPEGYCTLSPNDYIPYFQRRNIKLVVRLNKKNYNESDFLNQGIQHYEQFYTDGSCPTMAILQRILSQFDSTGIPSQSQNGQGTGGGGGAFAVHCKAGLGRTGTCIGAWLMKHYRLSAKDVIGWMRICRPGMVIGPQQQFLANIQSIMWQEGDMVRSLYPSNRTNVTTTGTGTGTGTAVVTPTRGGKQSSSSTTTSTASSPTSVTVLSACNSKEDGHEVLLLGGGGGGGEHGVHGVHVGGDDPGQADRLLAARLKQNRQRNGTSESNTNTNTNNNNNNNEKKPAAVPVTPDNNNNSSTKSAAGATQSLWARAFA
jgi:protein-tyrosine phosphatase